MFVSVSDIKIDGNKSTFSTIRQRFPITFLLLIYFQQELFVLYGGYSERMPPASNAPGYSVLATETRTAASSHTQPTSRVVDLGCCCHTDEKYVSSNTKWPIHIFRVRGLKCEDNNNNTSSAV